MNDLPAWLKPLMIGGTLAVLIVCESVAPMFLERRGRLRHDAANIALGLINALLSAVVLVAGIRWITDWTAAEQFGLLHHLPWTNANGWLAWLLAIVLFDAWMYAWHVLNHRVSMLWRFHQVHHADMELDASSAMRFHTGEIIASTLARMAVLPLLGMSFGQLLLYELLLQPVILLHHSNVRLPEWIDRVLRIAIVTPRIHWVHHSNRREETDSNYGSIFNFWDRLFRTLRRRPPAEITFGLKYTESADSRNLLHMLMLPFRSLRLLRSAGRAQSLDRSQQ